MALIAGGAGRSGFALVAACLACGPAMVPLPCPGAVVTTWPLPEVLTEVSGLALAPDSLIVAHQDERAVVYLLRLAGSVEVVAVREFDGRPRGDFEGIALLPDGPVLMTSDGTLLVARDTGAGPMPWRSVSTGFGDECELEGLALAPGTADLLIPCKRRRGADQPGLTVFRWDLAAGRPGAPLVVSGEALLTATGRPTVRATAVDVDPLSGHLLVLSSDPVGLLEIGSGVVRLRPLPAALHRQPEGLVRLPTGFLVADEGGAGAGGGTITGYNCPR